MRYFWMTLMSIFALSFAGCGDKEDDTSSADAAVEENADAGEAEAETGDAGDEDTSAEDGGSEDE